MWSTYTQTGVFKPLFMLVIMITANENMTFFVRILHNAYIENFF